LKILEDTKVKYDLSLALVHADIEISEKFVWKSSYSAGVSDWSFPPENEMSWDNHLTGIESFGEEFNFVFKNGKTSNAPISCKANQI
jgi:hypothetical protein